MVTLTYADEHLPEGLSLWAPDVVNFRKRLRINFERAIFRDARLSSLSSAARKAMARLRFYVVAEYGTRGGRPHFHCAVFGADRFVRINGKPFKRFIDDAWGKGSTHPGRQWSAAAAGYLSGYMSKGWNTQGLAVLEGRVPEFAMYPSGKLGGLGKPGLVKMLPDLLAGRDGREIVAREGDVPHVVDLPGGARFIGPFLLRKLRLLYGMTPDEIFEVQWRQSYARMVERLERSLDRVLAAALSSCSFEVAADAIIRLQLAYGAQAPPCPSSPVRRLRDLLFCSVDRHVD